ncbi:MAG TPA: hypothetical protein DDY78_05195 [Planctomycetales bacterium]|nr:hypothetical protein [Planctomycetales bacterium]
MLTLNAHLFLDLMDALSALERTTAEMHKRLADMLVENGVEQTAAQNILMGWPVEGEAVQYQTMMRDALKGFSLEEWEPILGDLERQCALLQLKFSISQINRIRTMAGMESTSAGFAVAFGELRRRIMEEIKDRVFVSVAPETQKYIADKNPFGDEVRDRFLDRSEDMEACGECLGVGLPTACVFHLMRIMEAAVCDLASRLKTTVNPKDTWGLILQPIDAAIDALPHGKNASNKELAKHEAFSEAAAYLRHVKNAWRNNVMHPKRTYTTQEAQDIFDGTKTFLQSLIKLPRR